MGDKEFKFSSRRHIIDKERAIGTAKNPKDSHYGRTLLRNNIFEGRLLTSEMGKLGNEARRNQMHLDQQRKLFLKKNLSLPDPTILVERPPSAGVLKKALFPEEFTEDDYYFNDTAPPHYMKPRYAQVTAPSTHVIMDMFKVTKKKKFNVWEEVIIEKEEPHFESAVRPARKLSEFETKQLQQAWSLRRRQVESATVTPLQRTKTGSSLSIKPLEDFHRVKSAPQGRVPPSPSKDNNVKFGSATFITQLDNFREDDEISSVAESDVPDKAALSIKSGSTGVLDSKDKSKNNTNNGVGLISISVTSVDNGTHLEENTHRTVSGGNIVTQTSPTDTTGKASDKVVHDNQIGSSFKSKKNVQSQSKSNPRVLGKPSVIQATKKQKRQQTKSTMYSSSGDSTTTRTCKTPATTESTTMHSNRTRTPGSGKRKKKAKGTFLSLLVDCDEQS